MFRARRRRSQTGPRLPYSFPSSTSATSSSAWSTPFRSSIILANCWTSRCSTIPPTKLAKWPAPASSATPPQGLPIAYIHRTNREGYKAGALENGLQTAQGEFVAIFDADFIPQADFLRRTIPYFLNPDGGDNIGMVQTRWTYLNCDYSLLTRVETILLDGHFVIEHGGRSRRGTFFNFNGTAGVWRRAAIDAAGGWEHDTLTEDTDLSYRAQLKGWKFLYLPEHRVRLRTPRGHERLQSAASALGQGPDANREENPAAESSARMLPST